MCARPLSPRHAQPDWMGGGLVSRQMMHAPPSAAIFVSRERLLGVPRNALLHTPGGRELGPLERGFTDATSPEDFKGWVVGFYNEQSDELAKLPEMLADALIARWQSKYGRDPSDQQRSWLVNKIRTDIAMIGTKLSNLNAQVIIKNLQNMHAKSLPPTAGPRERERGWS